MMRNCPHCGGYFDESVKVCPIDGFDFEAEEKEEDKKRRIFRMKKIAKLSVVGFIILSILLASFSLVSGMLISKDGTIQNRLSFFTWSAENSILHNPSPYDRINRFGFNTDTVIRRVVFAAEKIQDTLTQGRGPGSGY